MTFKNPRTNGVNIQAGNASADVALSVGSASTPDKFIVEAGGNVGVGATPLTRLHVSDTDNAVHLIQQSNTLTGTKFAQLLLTNGPTLLGANDRTWALVNTYDGTSESNFQFQYWNGATYETPFRFTSGGALGIGETNPIAGSKLHVNNGDTGSTNVATSFRDVVVENSSNAGITVRSNQLSLVRDT